MTHSYDQPPTHGHFTDRGCSKCRAKDRQIEELEADAAVHDEQLTRVARIRLELEADNERLRAVYEAVKELPNRDGQTDTVRIIESIEKALAAVEGK